MNFIAVIVFALFLFCKSEPVCAQTFFGAGSEALGEAGRAANVALDAQWLNPAALAFSKDSNAGVAYQMVDATMPSPTSTTAAAITDNDPAKYFSGGIGFVNRRISTPTATITDQDISFDAAMKILPTISVGAQVHRLFRMDTIQPGFTSYDSTLGVMVLPRPWIGLALVYYDFINDPNGVLIPTAALGTHFIIMDIMRIRVDGTLPQGSSLASGGTLNTGLELDGGSGFLFRGGGMWDTLHNVTYWSAGISWEGPKLSVAYAFRANAALNNDNYQTFQAWIEY